MLHDSALYKFMIDIVHWLVAAKALVVITDVMNISSTVCVSTGPLSSTWPHLNSDVGLEEGEY